MKFCFILAILALVNLYNNVFGDEMNPARGSQSPRRSNRLQLLNNVVKARLLSAKQNEERNQKTLPFQKPVFLDELADQNLKQTSQYTQYQNQQQLQYLHQQQKQQQSDEKSQQYLQDQSIKDTPYTPAQAEKKKTDQLSNQNQNNKLTESQSLKKKAEENVVQPQPNTQIENNKEQNQPNSDGAYHEVSTSTTAATKIEQDNKSRLNSQNYYVPNQSFFSAYPPIFNVAPINPNHQRTLLPKYNPFNPTMNLMQPMPNPNIHGFNGPNEMYQMQQPKIYPESGFNANQMKTQQTNTDQQTTTSTTPSTTSSTSTSTTSTTTASTTSTTQSTTTVKPVQSKDQICTNKRHGDLISHPINKNQFIVCHRPGVYTVMDCPMRLLFNPHTERCDSDMTPPPNACLSNPCLNNGKCIDLPKYKFKCECEVGFYGIRCEKKDYCTPSPCGEKGICIPVVNEEIKYYCTCFNNQMLGFDCDKNVEKNPCKSIMDMEVHHASKLRNDAFIHCDGKIPHLKFCSNNLVFSASKQECDWDEN